MGLKGVYSEGAKLGVVQFTTNPDLAYDRIHRGSLFPDIPNTNTPPTPPLKKSLHHLDEYSPIIAPIAAEILQNPKTHALPKKEFNELIVTRVRRQLWRLIHERNEQAPNSRHTFFRDGGDRSKDKLDAIINRLRKSVAEQVERETKISHQQEVKKRKEEKNRKRNERRRRQRRVEREQERGVPRIPDDEDAAMSDAWKGAGESEGEVAETENGTGQSGGGQRGGEGGGKERDGMTGVEAEKVPKVKKDRTRQVPDLKPSIRTVEDIELPDEIDFMFVSEDHPDYLQAPNFSTIRIITPRQEAEGIIGLGATLATPTTEDRRILEVKYGPGADPASFPHEKMRTVSHLIDGDQFCTGNQAVIGWSFHRVTIGRANYDTHSIPERPGSPVPFDLPADKTKSIHCYRLIEFTLLLETLFKTTNQASIAGMMVLIGNEYSTGGKGITIRLLRQDEYKDLVAFLANLDEYDKAVIDGDTTLVAEFNAKYRAFLDKLPQSEYLDNLDLAKFRRKQKTTMGLYDDNHFDKRKFISDHFNRFRDEYRAKLKTRLIALADHVDRFCPKTSQPGNFPHLPGRLWIKEKSESREQGGGGGGGGGGGASPNSTNPSEGGGARSTDGGGGGESNEANEGGGGSKGASTGGSSKGAGVSKNNNESTAKVCHDRKNDPRLSDAEGNDLPCSRKPLDDFAEQLDEMKKRIVDPLPPPTGPPEPLEENIVHGVKFDDIKFGWSMLSSRLSQAYSHLVLVDEEGNPKVRDEEGNVIMPLEFHRAMFELEQGISIAGCPEAAAVNRVLGIALQIRLSEDPLAIFELEEMKRETIRDLMQMIAYERELYGSERPRRGTGEPGILKHWRTSIVAAVEIDQEATQEIYTAPSTQDRLDPTVVNLATSTCEQWKKKGEGMTSIDEFIKALFISPVEIYDKLCSLLPTFFSKLSLPNPSPLSPQALLLRQRLLKKGRKSVGLANQVRNALLAQHSPEWTNNRDKPPPPLDSNGLPSFPPLPDQLKSLIRQKIETICSQVESLDEEPLHLSRSQIVDFSNDLFQFLEIVFFIVPHLFIELGAQAIAQSMSIKIDPPLEPDGVTARNMKLRSGGWSKYQMDDDNRAVKAKVSKVFPTTRSLRELLENRGAGSRDEDNNAFFATCRGFRRFLATLSGTLNQKFAPSFFHFDHTTTYYYATGSNNPGPGETLATVNTDPPAVRALQNHFDNSQRSMQRFDERLADRERERRQDRMQGVHDIEEEGRDELESDREGNVYQANDDSSEEEDEDPYSAQYLARHQLDSLDPKTRKSKDLTKSTRGKRSIPGQPPSLTRSSPEHAPPSAPASSTASDSASPRVEHPDSRSSSSPPSLPDPTPPGHRRFAGRAVNGAHGLLRAQRIAIIKTSYPHLRVCEALGGCSFYDVAKEQPESGWVNFEFNKDRLMKACRSYQTIFEAIIRKKGGKLTRTDIIRKSVPLRHEILSALLNVVDDGIRIPRCYSVGPDRHHVTYRDLRKAENRPGLYDDYAEYGETLGNVAAYKFLNLDAVREQEQIVKKVSHPDSAPSIDQSSPSNVNTTIPDSSLADNGASPNNDVVPVEPIPIPPPTPHNASLPLEPTPPQPTNDVPQLIYENNLKRVLPMLVRVQVPKKVDEKGKGKGKAKEADASDKTSNETGAREADSGEGTSKEGTSSQEGIVSEEGVSKEGASKEGSSNEAAENEGKSTEGAAEEGREKEERGTGEGGKGKKKEVKLEWKWRWTSARKRSEKDRKISTPQSTGPYYLDLKYGDSDKPQSKLWDYHLKTEKQRENFKKKSGEKVNAKYRWEMREDLSNEENVTVVYVANDKGIVYPFALTWYFPQTRQAYFDIMSRKRIVGNQRLRSKVATEMRKCDGTVERDSDFAQLNEDPNEKVGAAESIKQHNILHPESPIAPELGHQSAASQQYSRDRARAEADQLKRDVATMVSSMLPPQKDQEGKIIKTYRVVLFDGPEGISMSAGRSGATKDKAWMDALLEYLHSRTDIEVIVFLMEEHFTSQTCCFCEMPTVFHPEDIYTGYEIGRVTCCYDCWKIFHRDEGASRLFLLGAIVASKTLVQPFSPNHEKSTYGRPIKERDWDGQERRPRGIDLKKLAKFHSRRWIAYQEAAYAAKALLELPTEDEDTPEIKGLREELERMIKEGDPTDWKLTLPKKEEIIEPRLVPLSELTAEMDAEVREMFGFPE